MPSIRIRRAVVILILAVASSILPLADLHAAPRGGERPERGVTRVLRQNPVWKLLVSLWEEAGLRIDDNG